MNEEYFEAKIEEKIDEEKIDNNVLEKLYNIIEQKQILNKSKDGLTSSNEPSIDIEVRKLIMKKAKEEKQKDILSDQQKEIFIRKYKDKYKDLNLKFDEKNKADFSKKVSDIIYDLENKYITLNEAEKNEELLLNEFNNLNEEYRNKQFQLELLIEYFEIIQNTLNELGNKELTDKFNLLIKEFKQDRVKLRLGSLNNKEEFNNRINYYNEKIINFNDKIELIKNEKEIENIDYINNEKKEIIMYIEKDVDKKNIIKLYENLIQQIFNNFQQAALNASPENIKKANLIYNNFEVKYNKLDTLKFNFEDLDTYKLYRETFLEYLDLYNSEVSTEFKKNINIYELIDREKKKNLILNIK